MAIVANGHRNSSARQCYTSNKKHIPGCGQSSKFRKSPPCSTSNQLIFLKKPVKHSF